MYFLGFTLVNLLSLFGTAAEEGEIFNVIRCYFQGHPTTEHLTEKILKNNVSCSFFNSFTCKHIFVEANATSYVPVL